jgi:hypothetical protein
MKLSRVRVPIHESLPGRLFRRVLLCRCENAAGRCSEDTLRPIVPVGARPTELSEIYAANQIIHDIAGRLSRKRLTRYSHIRLDAKRKALDAIAKN